MHHPPLPPRKYSWYSFVLRGWANPRTIVQLEGLWQRKMPMKPSGIEPTTFWLVVQYLTQLTTVYASVHCKWVLCWRIQVFQDVTLCRWTSVSLCFEHSAFIFNGQGSTHFGPLGPWKIESSRALQCKINSGLLFQSSSVQAPNTLDFTSLDGRNRTNFQKVVVKKMGQHLNKIK